MFTNIIKNFKNYNSGKWFLSEKIGSATLYTCQDFIKIIEL
jgi:hypothetical protein